MPHCFKMQHSPKAFSHKPSTPQNKHGFRCELLHEFCEKWATKVPNHINGEPNNQGKLHLLVRRELKHEKGSKNSTMEAWGLFFFCSSRELGSFWSEGEEFWVKKMFPLHSFIFSYRGCSPRRANLHFFGGYQISAVSYGSVFAYSNPHRVD